MTIYFPPIAPTEIVRLVRAEVEATGGQPELYWNAFEDYMVEEDFDRKAHGIEGGSEYSLITEEARLNVEPRLEQNYWVLTILVHREIGPRIVEDDSSFIGVELTLEEFEERFLVANESATVRVRLDTQTPLAKEHFDRWWTELNARHPR